MNYRLCSIPTIDGLLLDGAFAGPEGKVLPTGRAWVFVHGTGANFTSTGVLSGLTELFVERGDAVLRLNTRGHDLMARIPAVQGAVPGGAAYERLEEAPHDIAAACNWLGDQGYRRISLLGHSLGGVKIILAQSMQRQAEVEELVALSAPRLYHDNLKANVAFREDYLAAAELVAGGRGHDLVRMREPLPLVMSAEGVMQKYGPADRFDIIHHLTRINEPALMIVDAKSPESNPAFTGILEALTRLRATNLGVELFTPGHGDISYRNVEIEIVTAIESWRRARAADVGISI